MDVLHYASAEKIESSLPLAQNHTTLDLWARLNRQNTSPDTYQYFMHTCVSDLEMLLKGTHTQPPYLEDASYFENLLGYSRSKWELHLSYTLPPFIPLGQAYMYHYQRDHILPKIVFKTALQDTPFLAYRMMNILENLEMIPTTDNARKSGSVNFERYPHQIHIPYILKEKGFPKDACDAIFEEVRKRLKWG